MPPRAPFKSLKHNHGQAANATTPRTSDYPTTVDLPEHAPTPYCATNDVTVSELTLTVYFSPDTKSEPSGTVVSTNG